MINAAVVQLDRTSVYETEGLEFESLQPRQTGLRRSLLKI